MESSYENVAPLIVAALKAQLLDDIEEEYYDEVASPKLIVRFRRMPVPAALTTQRDAIGDCAFRTGHILQLINGRIICQSCGAIWCNEGF